MVVPGFNRFHYLERLVESVHQHADMPFELLIHDDNSDDGTRERLSELSERVSAVILSHGPALGLAESVNRLVRLAGSDTIIMLNADCRADKPFFRDVHNVLKLPFVGYVSLLTTDSTHFAGLRGAGPTRFIIPRGMGLGGAIAFHRDPWANVGGWDSHGVLSNNSDVSFMCRTIMAGYFPALLFDRGPCVANMSMVEQAGKDSTIGRRRFDVSGPRLFACPDYDAVVGSRVTRAARSMAEQYTAMGGACNIEFWQRFTERLIEESYQINWTVAHEHGHDRWQSAVDGTFVGAP